MLAWSGFEASGAFQGTRRRCVPLETGSGAYAFIAFGSISIEPYEAIRRDFYGV